MVGNKMTSIFLIAILITSLTGIAFAESGNDDNATIGKNSTATDQQSKDNQQSDEQSRQNDTQSQDQNKTEGEQHSEYDQQSLNENSQNKTEEENQTQSDQERMDEINNENNNEKATHQENQQDTTDIENAVENKTVAAEVNIGQGNTETKSIDDNIEVHTDNPTGDNVSVTVDSKTASGPKVIIFNLNSTSIDVANVKYLHVTYDGQSIQPATDVNSVLHPKSTDNPSYAIIVTQDGAQILVSIPHFSTHTITLGQINKVIPAVPEFPIVMMVMPIGIALAVALYRIKLIKI